MKTNFACLTLIIFFFGFTALPQKPPPKLLDRSNHVLIMIDHQPQMTFATQTHTIAIRNATMIAKALIVLW